MEKGRGTELAGQNPRTRHTNTKNRIPRSGQFQGQGYPSFPHWEKKFCTSICKMSWKKICETQKITYLYPKIDEWDDSGAKEAFDKGKARYWAEINDLPCDIPWPSPDEYIDFIDHDTVVDPKLLEDLYEVPETISEEKHDNQVTDQYVKIQPTGWGDEVIESNYSNGEVIKYQPTGWDSENEQTSELINGYQFLEGQSNLWTERKNPDTKINSADDYEGFKVNRDYNCSKKEFGRKIYKSKKKSSYAINPSVNWKAQHESSWQWQKNVTNNDETGGGSNICWDSYQPAIDTSVGTGREYDEEKYNNQAEYTNATDRYIDIKPTGWVVDITNNQCNNEAVIQNQPTGWGHEDEQAPELNSVNQFPEEQYDQWIDSKNRSSNINSPDNGDFQVSSNYNYGKKEFGSKRGKGRKKTFYAVNPRVNWKAQRESSWQWQKIVF